MVCVHRRRLKKKCTFFDERTQQYHTHTHIFCSVLFFFSPFIVYHTYVILKSLTSKGNQGKLNECTDTRSEGVKKEREIGERIERIIAQVSIMQSLDTLFGIVDIVNTLSLSIRLQELLFITQCILCYFIKAKDMLIDIFFLKVIEDKLYGCQRVNMLGIEF